MTGSDYRDPRLTEQRNPRTERIDVASTLEIVDLLNGEDATVADAVRAVRAELARAIDLVVDAFGRGGRLIYVGAGTSRPRGGLVSCSDPPGVRVETWAVLVLPKVGPEALTGSPRMKAGTATKLVLNTLSTGAMIRLGRAYGNLMVDLMALSDKLRDRGERIVMECCNVDRAAARGAIEAAGGSVKLAIVMARRGVRKAEAERLLAEAGGVVRKAAGGPPPGSPPRPRAPRAGARPGRPPPAVFAAPRGPHSRPPHP